MRISIHQQKEREYFPLRNKQGTTMVEVLVAVMIVMIVVVMFGKVVSASVNLYQKASKAISQTEAFDEVYYKKSSTGTTVKGKDGQDITFVLEEKRSAAPAIIKLPRGELKKFTDAGQTNITRYSIDVKPVSDEP